MGGSTSKLTQLPENKMSENEIMDVISSFMGDNGPGDQYIGDFAINYKSASNKSEILQGQRFYWCGKNKKTHMTIVVTKQQNLYVIQQVNPNKRYDYKLKISSGNTAKLNSKWHSEHARKTCKR